MSAIQILTPTEIRNYEMPPIFDSFQRKKFFTLPIGLTKEIEELRNSSGKISFILQVGYFRSSRRFFGNNFYQSDIAFVAGRLDLPIPNSLEIPKQTLARHRTIIAEFYGFRNLSKNDKEQLVIETADLVKQFHRPAEVFRQTIKKLNSRKFVLPGYDKLPSDEKLSEIKTILLDFHESRQAIERQIFEMLDNTDSSAGDSEFYNVLEQKSLTLHKRTADIISFCKWMKSRSIRICLRLCSIFKPKTEIWKKMLRRSFCPKKNKTQ